MRTATVTLGGKEYVVSERRTRENSEWRASLSAWITEMSEPWKLDSDAALSPALIVNLIHSGSDLLLGSTGKLTEMLFDYAPELASDAEQIKAESYDSEVLTAFVEILKLAFPFGPILQTLLKALPSQPGPAKPRTSRK
jgi:hypothetical protein